MLENAPSDPILSFKIIAGIAAVCLNTLASFLVYKRLKCYQADDEEGYLKYNLLHDRIGVGCVFSISAAIALGGYYLVV